MDQRTNTPGVHILVDPTPDTRIMAPAPGGPGFAAPPPPPGNLQDVRTFPVPGENANLRVAMIDGEPWFVAADVSTMLGHSNTAMMIKALKPSERGVRKFYTPGGQQEFVIVSEPGFYRLVMRSNRPEADAFQTWVTGDVLPQIRKTGAYTVQRGLGRKELAMLVIEAEEARERIEAENVGLRQELVLIEGDRRSITEANVQARELLGAAHEMLTEAQPKVDGYDQLLNSDGNYSLAAAAQACGLGRQKFISQLAAYGGIIVRPGTSDHLRPYQQHVKAGRFVVKIRVFDVVKDGQTETRSEGTTYVTPKGLDWFRGK